MALFWLLYEMWSKSTMEDCDEMSNQITCNKCSGKLRLYNKWYYECRDCFSRQLTGAPFITREEAMKTHTTKRVGIVQ
jgi:DNA-directed RNA polymerase subunit RPC12/RpoP